MAEPFVILVERCRMELLPTFFDSCSVPRARKAYKYLFQEPHRNGETIAKLANYLTAKTAEAKETWKNASIDFQNGYRRPDGTLATRKSNKILLDNAKSAKLAYERYTKKQTYFEALKAKYENLKRS